MPCASLCDTPADWSRPLDAIPKKRGPKTDVLEALLKRVNGLEKRLKDENKAASPPDPADESAIAETVATVAAATVAPDSEESREQQDHQESRSVSTEPPVIDHAPRPPPPYHKPTARWAYLSTCIVYIYSNTSQDSNRNSTTVQLCAS